MNTRRAFLALAVTLAAALAGCAAIESVIEKTLGIEHKIDLRTLQIVAQADANTNSATALDVVFVFDDTAKGMLPRTGPEWFANKQALLAGFPKSFSIVPFQLPPSTAANYTITSAQRQAIAVYSYANYIAPGGQPVGNLTPYTCVQVSLQPAAVAYANCPKGKDTP